MKLNILKKVVAFTVTVLLGCIGVDAQTVTVTSDTGDALTVEIVQEQIKEKKALDSAFEILYTTVFFRGFPDSQSCKNALVGTDEEFVKQHPEYFKQMQESRFRSFVNTARVVDFKKKNKVSTCRFVVNIKALRLDLEQQGVRRRFGF